MYEKTIYVGRYEDTLRVGVQSRDKEGRRVTTYVTLPKEIEPLFPPIEEGELKKFVLTQGVPIPKFELATPTAEDIEWAKKAVQDHLSFGS